MNIFDVYSVYNKAKCDFHGKKQRTITEISLNRVSPDNIDNIKLLCGYFNTIYSNVDLYQYMICGFQIWKSFGYSKLTDKKIIERYIITDKRNKRQFDVTDNQINDTLSFINEPLDVYCTRVCNNDPKIVYDYLRNKIDCITFTYCIFKKYIIIDESLSSIVSVIIENYDELIQIMLTKERIYLNVKTIEK